MANLTMWDPFGNTPLRQAMDRLFEDAWVRPWNLAGLGNAGQGNQGFALDFHETGDDYVLTASLPGVRPEDVEITTHGNVLTINAESKMEEGDAKDKNYHTRERFYGRYSRQMALPSDVNTDGVEARMENGVLHLRLPKAETAKPRRIEIQGGSTPAVSGGTQPHVLEHGEGHTEGEAA